MGKSDDKALTDLGLGELSVITTSGATAADYVLVVDVTTKVPTLMLISDLDKLIT